MNPQHSPTELGGWSIILAHSSWVNKQPSNGLVSCVTCTPWMMHVLLRFFLGQDSKQHAQEDNKHQTFITFLPCTANSSRQNPTRVRHWNLRITSPLGSFFFFDGDTSWLLHLHTANATTHSDPAASPYSISSVHLSAGETERDMHADKGGCQRINNSS